MTMTWAPPTWTVGDRIRKERERKGLEQSELAELTGLSRQTIGNYENGRTKPTKASYKLLSLALGAPVEWLSDGIVRPEGFEPPAYCSVAERDVPSGDEDWGSPPYVDNRAYWELAA